MNLIGIKYGDREYINLSTIEYIIIHRYLNEWDMDALTGEVRHADETTQGMREFIADVMSGKITRPKGKKSLTMSRDIEIYKEIKHLLQKGDRITSAINTVAKNRHMTPDAVRHVHSKEEEMNNRLDKRLKELEVFGIKVELDE